MILKLVILFVCLEAMAGEDAYCDKNDLRYLFAKVHNMEKQVNKLNTELEELNSKFDETSVKLNSGISNISEQLKSITTSTALRGGWSDWSAWGSCSATCGTGLQRRTRTCSNPSPDLHGRPCVGDYSDYQHCAITSCYVCPDGWLRHGSSCYFFSNTNGDITLGQRQCSMWRGHLVEIENDAENSFLKEQISNSNEFYYYIGLNDINKESSFTWFGTNRILSQTGYSHWFQGEPNNAEDKEDCVVIRKGDGYWNDYICDGPIPYICEMKYLI